MAHTLAETLAAATSREQSTYATIDRAVVAALEIQMQIDVGRERIKQSLELIGRAGEMLARSPFCRQ